MDETNKLLNEMGRAQRRELDDATVPPHRMAQLMAAFERPQSTQSILDFIQAAGQIITRAFEIEPQGQLQMVRGPEQSTPSLPTYRPDSDFRLALKLRMGGSLKGASPLFLLKAPGQQHYRPLEPQPALPSGGIFGATHLRLDPQSHLTEPGDYSLAVIVLRAKPAVGLPPSVMEEEMESVASSPQSPVHILQFRYQAA